MRSDRLIFNRACRYNEHPNLFLRAVAWNVAVQVPLVVLAKSEEDRKLSTGHSRIYYALTA